jgi:hypothetical protein
MMQHVSSVNSAFVYAIGKTMVGVAATGEVPTTGWTNPILAPRFYVVPPADGYLDLDFYADEPSGIVIPMPLPTAAWLVLNRDPENYWGKGKPLAGVRVHAATNKVETKYNSKNKYDALMVTAETMAEGLPLPWPFPWKFGPRTFGDEDPFPLSKKDARINCLASLCELLGKKLRVYRTGDPLTLDYLTDRANIELNPKTLRIVDVWFG